MGQRKSRMLTPDLPDQASAKLNIFTPQIYQCLCSIPSGTEAASSFFYSERIAELSEQRSKFDNQLEFDVESSTSHWTAVSAATANSDDSDEQVSNSEVFEKLKEHPEWGPFFRRQPYELEIGDKIAEGGQAEIFEALGVNKYATNDPWNSSKDEKAKLVLKVFKAGFPLNHLQRMWPPGLVTAAIPHRYFVRNGAQSEGRLCWALGAQLLDNGRLAYIFDRYWGDLCKLIDEKMLKKNGCPPFSRETTYENILLIARGMHNLHKLGFLHNDLKAANVLINNPTEGRVITVIADFESSVGIEGTGFWRAPEVLLAVKNRKNQQGTFTQETTQQTDVYSFAMTCYEGITSRMPFEGLDVQDDAIILSGGRPKLPGDPYSMYSYLITKCWHQDPRHRPSFAQIVAYLETLDSLSVPDCAFRRRGDLGLPCL